MGRQGPRLVPFLEIGLNSKKYQNLIWEDLNCQIFSLVLPHKTKKLNAANEHVFKDWYKLNSKKYIIGSKHYTDAKQAITASLRKSDYVEKVFISDDRLTYRILNKAEVKEKKMLKKAPKRNNQIKPEVSDNEDALSSGESGYGTGNDSPRSDHGIMSMHDNIISSDNEFSKSLFEINDVQLSTHPDALLAWLKPEHMDVDIATEISLAIPNAPVMFENDFHTEFPTFADSPESAEFAENNKHLLQNLELTDCSFDDPKMSCPDFIMCFPSENEAVNEDMLQLDGMFNEYLLNNTFLNEASTFNSIPNEKQNSHGLPLDALTDEEFHKLMTDIGSMNLDSSFTSERKDQEQVASSIDPCLPVYKTAVTERIYLCKQCIHLGETSIMFGEPQFVTDTVESSDNIKIAFEEPVLKEIFESKAVKDVKFNYGHLWVILEPNDN